MSTQPISFELRPRKDLPPGQAILHIQHWQGPVTGLSLSITRNQDSYYLAQNNQWLGQPVLHDLPPLNAESEDSFWVEVGPTLVDPLLQDQQMAYRLVLSSEQTSSMGILRITPGILSSPAVGNSTREAMRISVEVPPPEEPTPPEPAPKPAMELVPEPELERQKQPDPEPEPEPESHPPEYHSGKSKWLILLLILLLIAAGAAAWWFLLRPQPTVEPSSPTPAGDCSPQAMGNQQELPFVQGCIKSGMSSEQLLQIIEEAKTAGRCAIAQRLYAYKAQAGDAAIGLAYAHEYDEVSNEKGGCFQTDKETAIYWYETVLQHDANNAQAKARLQELKK